ncbi:carbon monoxide dehydrogenase beta subunit family protein [Dethiobacter alkaliphilus]|uniref:CO dehydrogenase beta subunit/acetyl-CoA synthase epsilon subunit n=1 Tax=Dethiobacter alkaliphilus AHT 1 TaxID=555088 RepID=C0GC10_DETAL|nr:carbon monoxide dehydrogenase beta subunit family protein [Dethiobacter alkaliphilus]EEG78745.1 CO dehydrogenase beta subunit/acetyl-CoA synthase epsilon subunit [Dethiobacter alkaliphilus AHT 1]
MLESKYQVLTGPEGYLPPAAASKGVTLPDEGLALVEGTIVPEKDAIEKIAEKILQAKNPFFFPGPLLLWDWKEGVAQKAALVKKLAEVAGIKIIPMPDYRPKYPMINPDIEINPNHPNLTIWHNKIDLCLFIGVHCHYANVALKIIRGGTDCYTIALCGEAGHEDAMISLRDVGLAQLEALIEAVTRLKGVANS